MPPYAFLFVFINRVNEGLHTFSVEAIRFRQVAYVDSYNRIRPDIHAREIVPLKKGTVCISIVLQVQVVFTVDFHFFLFLPLFLLLLSFVIFIC